MKRTCLALLILGLSFSALSQMKMIINKHDGTKAYYTLSTVDSLNFSDAIMVTVTGGTFDMGSSPDELPIHTVTVGSFSIDEHEITYGKWTEVRNWALTHGYGDLRAGQDGNSPVGANNPVTMVSWYDAVKWCNARSEKDGLAPVYYTANDTTTVYRSSEIAYLQADCVKWNANGYRLPTEAEWEFAAKGGTLAQPTPYTYSGSNTIGDVAWYTTNSTTATHTVMTKTANELGIYDMSGNVEEWCWDFTGSYTSDPQTDPKGGASAIYRISRGGRFGDGVSSCRVAYRGNNWPTNAPDNYGFRCVKK